MANLLANPSDWQDSESTSPPVCWNGTAYVWETADPPNLFVLDFTGSASGSDVVSFTISAPGFIAERYLNICSDSEVLASYPLLSPPSTQIDVSATEVSKIVVSSDAGSIFPNTTYEGVLTLSLPQVDSDPYAIRGTHRGYMGVDSRQTAWVRTETGKLDMSSAVLTVEIKKMGRELAASTLTATSPEDGKVSFTIDAATSTQQLAPGLWMFYVKADGIVVYTGLLEMLA